MRGLRSNYGKLEHRLGPQLSLGCRSGKTTKQFALIYAARSLSDCSLTVAVVSSNPFS
jgi:hypothetical protein